MRARGKFRRPVAMVAATALAMLVPAGPLASAQPTEPNYDDTSANATPPPPDMSLYPPTDNGVPNPGFTRDANQVACVASLQEQTDLTQKPWGQDVLRLTDAHQYATGEGVTVAVIDTGIYDKHQFFQGRVRQSDVDYVNSDQKTDPGPNGSGNPYDCDGHGTQVAGIIAGNPGSDTIGFTGVAPRANLLSIRQSSQFYEDATQQEKPKAGNLDTLASAVIKATNEGAKVINMSIDACRSAIKGEITDAEKRMQLALLYAVENDVVPVVSAGNKPNNADCADRQNSADPDNPTLIVAPPWFADLVLSVAAIEESGDVAPFSIHGPWISVAAPGTDIISLDPANAGKLVNQTSDGQGQPQSIQGTSFAAPYVAGLAALIRERFPNLDARQVMHRIKATAAHPAGSEGRNIEVGNGMIDPVAALTEVIPGENDIAADKPVDLPSDLPPPYEHNWAPMQVALIGSGGGLALLLVTLFIVRTVRRNRPDSET